MFDTFKEIGSLNLNLTWPFVNLLSGLLIVLKNVCCCFLRIIFHFYVWVGILRYTQKYVSIQWAHRLKDSPPQKNWINSSSLKYVILYLSNALLSEHCRENCHLKIMTVSACQGLVLTACLLWKVIKLYFCLLKDLITGNKIYLSNTESF